MTEMQTFDKSVKVTYTREARSSGGRDPGSAPAPSLLPCAYSRIGKM